MPLYEYKCNVCGHYQTELRPVSEWNMLTLCEHCGSVTTKIVSTPSIVTDTNFYYTGKYDSRLGSVVEGRKDWKKKVAAKGYREADIGFVSETNIDERIKKHNLGI